MREIVEQYRIIAAGAGWSERADRGRLRVAGRDAVEFLQALLTNDISALQPGAGAYAAYLTPQGRMLADLFIYHCGDYLLIDVADTQAAPLVQRLDGLIFTEDVRVSDASSEISQLTVFGQTAPAVLAHAFSVEPLNPERLALLPLRNHVEVGGVRVARTDEIDLPVFDVFLAPAELQTVSVRLNEMGAVHTSPALLDALRIEAGRPVYGRDMDTDTIPLEAGLLDRAISTSKGCYVGQEIVIRILHRGGGRVAKRLVKLLFDKDSSTVPAAGTSIQCDGRDIGRVTSAAVSPRTGRVVALGYVHRDHSEPGTRLSVGSETAESSAEITALAG
jgi:folate-binding protein YgfZ